MHLKEHIAVSRTVVIIVKAEINTPGTAVGQGGRDRIYLLVMPKYLGNKFSASGVSPKWVKSNRRKRKQKKRERKKVGNNNGQLRIAKSTSGGARKATWANLVGFEKKIIFAGVKNKF